MLQQLASRQEAVVAAGGVAPLGRQEVVVIEWIGWVVHHQISAGLPLQLLLQPVDPLAHRGGWREVLPAALIPAAPGHQQVIPGREQGFEKHIAVLVGWARIP